MKKLQKTIAQDVVLEWLEENGYVADENWITADGTYFQYKDAVQPFAKQFHVYKSTAYRSLRDTIDAIGLSVDFAKRYNRITQGWNNKPSTTDFGKWYRTHYGRRADDPRLYAKLYMRYKAGKLVLS